MQGRIDKCSHCKKRQTAKTYETKKNGVVVREYYCLECYDRLFLDVKRSETNTAECPYCGMAVQEIREKKLVGCAHCYDVLYGGVYPLIKKMQGERAHRGKTPPLDGDYGDPYDFDDVIGARYRAKAVERARFERQKTELETIIKKLEKEGNFEDKKSYEEKLTAMENSSTVEEDFVWRTRRSLKQS